MRMLHIISEAQIKLKDASQPRIQFEITLLKLIHMERSEQLSELLAGLQELKKNSGNFVATSKNGSAEKKPESEPSEQPDKVSEPEQNDSGPADEVDNKREYKSSSNSSEEIEAEENSEPVEKVEQEPEPIGDEQDEEDDFDIGAPALITTLTRKARASAQTDKQNQTTNSNGSPSVQSAEKAIPEKITTEYIQEIWVEYLESLKGDFPMLLHLQMERAKVKKVKGGELHLECDNDFAQKMLDEQSTDLQFKLKEFTGSVLRFNISVGEKDEKDKPMSVYERFKQIQQKDPIIRDIVEIFGAELEY